MVENSKYSNPDTSLEQKENKAHEYANQPYRPHESVYRRGGCTPPWISLLDARMDRKRQGTPQTALTKAVRFDTLNVMVYDQAKRCSPMLTRGQARDVLAAVLRRLYDAGGGQLATAEFILTQGVLAHELQLSRQWLGVLLTRLQETGWIVFEGAGGAATRFRAGPQLMRVERLLREDVHAGAHTEG